MEFLDGMIPTKFKNRNSGKERVAWRPGGFVVRVDWDQRKLSIRYHD